MILLVVFVGVYLYLLHQCAVAIMEAWRYQYWALVVVVIIFVGLLGGAAWFTGILAVTLLKSLLAFTLPASWEISVLAVTSILIGGLGLTYHYFDKQD